MKPFDKSKHINKVLVSAAEPEGQVVDGYWVIEYE